MPSKHPNFNQEQYRKMQQKNRKMDREAASSCRPKVTTAKKAPEYKEYKENLLQTVKLMKTEHKDNFAGSKCNIESRIKDKNLNTLKYTYKLNFNV